MSYRVFFTTGQSILIREAAFNEVIKDNTSKGLIIDNSNIVCYLNMNHITYIIPEQEASSGIKSSPKPEDIRQKAQEKEDSIKGDSTQILDRAKKSYDERG